MTTMANSGTSSPVDFDECEMNLQYFSYVKLRNGRAAGVVGLMCSEKLNDDEWIVN